MPSWHLGPKSSWAADKGSAWGAPRAPVLNWPFVRLRAQTMASTYVRWWSGYRIPGVTGINSHQCPRPQSLNSMSQVRFAVLWNLKVTTALRIVVVPTTNMFKPVDLCVNHDYLCDKIIFLKMTNFFWLIQLTGLNNKKSFPAVCSNNHMWIRAIISVWMVELLDRQCK